MMVVTGGTGKLGVALSSVFPMARFPTRSELNIRDTKNVNDYIMCNTPDVVLHTAAMTDVRRAQESYETCWDTNVRGTERIVDALKKWSPDCYFLYVSTACVFDGIRGDFDETSIPDPKNHYSMTKLIGEFVAKRLDLHLIIRTNFIERSTYPYPRAFTDRFGTYLFADDVAKAIRQITDERLQGVVHIAGERKMSMFELAQITSPEVGPMTMDEVDIPLTVDMSLRSVRIAPFSISTKPKKE